MKPELEIRQHNALTNARYSYSEMQLDLLFFLISRLRRDEPTAIYELSIQDLAALTGKQYHYTYLRKATEGMGSHMFEVEDEHEYTQLWLFQYVRYLKGQGTIQLKLSELAIPYLFDLKDNFTSYGLAAALRLSSKYAKRIYQFCSQWKDKGETRRFELAELRKMLRLVDDKGNEKMRQLSELKSKVLDPAVKQISEHTELHVGYRLEKKGRTYQSVVFTVKPQALAETIPFDLVATTPTPPGLAAHQVENAARLLTQIGIITPALVEQILSTPAHVVACNKFAHDVKTGKVKVKSSLAGLLLTVLGLKKSSPTGPLFDAKPAG